MKLLRVRGWERRKIGSHNRERQRETAIEERKIDLTLVHMQSVEDP